MTQSRGKEMPPSSYLDNNIPSEMFRFHSDNYDWEPKLHPYQQYGSNVLFFTFINPATMEVPVAFKKLGEARYSLSVSSLILFFSCH